MRDPQEDLLLGEALVEYQADRMDVQPERANRAWVLAGEIVATARRVTIIWLSLTAHSLSGMRARGRGVSGRRETSLYIYIHHCDSYPHNEL